LPWLLWTRVYYGHFLPNTIVAKQVFAPPHSAGALVRGLVSLRDLDTAATLTFGPTYLSFGGWPAAVLAPAAVIGIVAALYWLVPFASRAARATSFAFFTSLFYLSHVIIAMPWYLPAAAIIGILALGLMGHDLTRLREYLTARGLTDRARLVGALSLGTGVALVAFTTTVLVLSAYQLRIQQREIEGNRRALGLWLREHSQPADRVFLEPLGYIGFYSGLKMLDHPGLSSPEVVATIRELGSAEWPPIVRRLQPEWLVLRPIEARRIFADSVLRASYQVATTFDATARLETYGWIPGRGYLDHDSTFLVIRRTSVLDPKP
jgi:hypothetical protein